MTARGGLLPLSAIVFALALAGCQSKKPEAVLAPSGKSAALRKMERVAIAARMPVMRAVAEKAAKGVRVMGVCNGFQILLEAGLLPGALMRNASLKFVCREVKLEVTNTDTAFTRAYAPGQVIRCPVAHHDGNYFADAETLARVEGNGQVAFRYAEGTNPNGSINDIAGIVSERGNVLGLMPHPENLIETAHGGSDGRPLFESVLGLAA